ncbi:hypothetical protein [Rhodohalobacter mucosus]|uniref:DUF4249 family protein n=1 Tax=Rhodohalobacter mucosus TaxID=2079485 RepID=A0A316TNN4_9BACT|nr:hypothetical protein [Rhodohalobacter mucosus]PWN05261.1 hypothetical protein DDZ15_14370 [Rhodohalobacter mucosus]
MIIDSSGFGWLCLLSFIILICLGSCDSTVEPVSDHVASYSLYGVLDLEDSPNYIRVYDNSSLLTPESTQGLDVHILITDLTTDITTHLRDSVVVFDSIYTHNFVYESPVTFQNRYKIVLENNDGYRDSLISVTPSETELTLSRAAVECDQRFTVELKNIDLTAGEQLIAEAGIELSNTWYWTSREKIRSYDEESNTLIVGWSPDDISFDIFAGGFEGRPYPGCNEFTSNKVRFRFTHIGYMEGGKTNDEPLYDPEEGIQLQRKIVVGKYEGGVEVEIVPDSPLTVREP